MDDINNDEEENGEDDILDEETKNRIEQELLFLT